MNNNVLITGGLGYIGSFLTTKLLRMGFNVFIIDNECNTKRIPVLEGICNYIGDKCLGTLYVAKGNCTKICDVRKSFHNNNINTVIHLAGLKSVYESIKRDDEYTYNNIQSTDIILKVMEEYDVTNIIFSSSCTVYGDGNPNQYFVEEDKHDPQSPYALSKSICENRIVSNKNVSSIIFRYFNPVGYHESGFIYEHPPKKKVHNNLFYEISQVLLGNKKKLTIYGDCFDTCDGTAERNYFDINDLWSAHRSAFSMFGDPGEHEIFNLGNKTYTIQQIVDVFYTNNMFFEYEIRSAPKGAFSSTNAAIQKVKDHFGWEPYWNIEDSVYSIRKILKVQK